MGMTHYMELMMGSWQLLVLYMAVPMLLAESYVVSEILLFVRKPEGSGLKTFNRLCACVAAVGILVLALLAGRYFLGVEEWRTWVDVVAALSYVLAAVPFIFVALIETGVLLRDAAPKAKGTACVAAVVSYLILSHAAMVFGMFDPLQFGWQDSGMDRSMMSHGGMQTDHSMMSHGSMDHSTMNRGAQDPNDLTGRGAESGKPVPEGYHVMPDGRLMKNGPMQMNKQTPAGAECPHLKAMAEQAQNAQPAPEAPAATTAEDVKGMLTGSSCGTMTEAAPAAGSDAIEPMPAGRHCM